MIFAKLKKIQVWIYFLSAYWNCQYIIVSVSHNLNELFLLWRLCLLSAFRDQRKHSISQHTDLMFPGFLTLSVCLSVLWCLQYFKLCDLVVFIRHKNYHLLFFQVLLFQILAHPYFIVWLWAWFVLCLMYPTWSHVYWRLFSLYFTLCFVKNILYSSILHHLTWS